MGRTQFAAVHNDIFNILKENDKLFDFIDFCKQIKKQDTMLIYYMNFKKYDEALEELIGIKDKGLL